jgi:hypothetical protein
MSSIVTSARARRGSSQGLILAVLFTLASPLLLYLIIRTAVVGLSSATAASLPPQDLTPVLRQLLPRIADPRVPVPQQITTMARASVSENPLAYEPFFVFGKKAGDDGDLKRAIALMEESRRRRPNLLITRLLLMSYYGAAKRYPDALREMDYTLRSSEDVRRVVLPELVKTMRVPEGRRAVAEVLAGRPVWREEFIKTAQSQAATLRPEQARDLLDRVRALRPRADWSLEHALYIQSLASAGRVGEARSAWLDTIPQAERLRSRFISDGDFTGRLGRQSFGWTLQESDAGRAEIIASAGRDSYLEVTYFGGKNIQLAEQMLALAPGAYQLSFLAKSGDGIKSGNLSWAISCSPEGPELVRIRVADPQPSYRRYQGEVRVPASGCSGQRLRLLIEAGDMATGFNAQIAKMQMVRR